MSRGRQDPAAEAVDPLKLASLLLQYPDAELRSALAGVDERDLAGLGSCRRGVAALIEWQRATPAGEVCRTYTETFDFSKQRSLHLSYHLHGDRRQRGVALLRLKQAYEAAGYELSSTQLPDYLPLMLEFAALAGAAGRELLTEHAISIELVRASLRRDSNVFTPALDLVAEQLPGLSSRQLARLRRLAASGPPTEEVGLEPFAPPEVMGDGEGTVPLPMVGGR